MTSVPIDEAGYERLRRLVNIDLADPAQWQYIELQEDDGTIVWRGSYMGETNTTAADQVQEIELTVTGQDVIDHMGGDPLPVTVTTSVLKDTDTDDADELGSDTFADATLENSDDGVVITHQIEVPDL